MATSREMTEGRALPLIFNFTLPLLLGNLLQQTYSLVDAAIVGRFLGINALASVGASTSVVFLILGFCNGCCGGFGIPVAQKFGARDYVTMRRYVAVSLQLAAVMSVVIAVVTSIYCADILHMMSTPENIFTGAYYYLLVTFIGVPFTFFYNLLSSIIRALGDSKTPFWFLLLSTVLNILLDLFYILVLGWGVAGAAIATVFSQGVSAILCYIYMMRRFDILKTTPAERKFDGALARTLMYIGVPMGLQFSITAIGSIMLQSANNALGTACVAAFTAAMRIKMFFMCPFESLGMAMATYSGQNYGAGKPERIKPVYRDCILTVLLIGVPMCALLYFFGRPLLGIYIAKDDPAYASVLASGMVRVTYMGMTYFVCGIMETCCGMVRGLGRSWMPMVVTIFGACVLRIIWIYTIFQTHHTLDVLYLSYPVSWVVTSAVHVLCFILIYRRMMARWNAHKEEENASY